MIVAEAPPRIPDDLVQPFQVEPYRLRGRLVRMGTTLDAILSRHDYPPPVARLLGELVVLAATLASMLKFNGILTLQTKSDGPVKLLVADYAVETHAVRGYAQFDAARLAALDPDASVPRLLGAGHLAFTIDQGADTERYQGIVALEGTSLIDSVHHYFRQSEQIETGIRVAVGRAGGTWRGGAIMVQRLPETARGADGEARDDQFRHVMTLIGTCRDDELLSPSVAPTRLLFRLFHEEGVRVFPTLPLSDACRCSEERVVRILGSFPPAERGDLSVDGAIQVTCEFCGRRYRVDPAVLDSASSERPPPAF